MTVKPIDRTTQQVVNNAFYLIGLNNPNEEIPGYYTNEAIYLLNVLLDHYMAVERLIPYFTKFEFTLTPGIGQYIIGEESYHDISGKKITSIGASRVIINNVSYPLEQIKYFNLNQVTHTTNIRARPTTIILQNQYDASVIYLYPLPDRTYSLEMEVKQRISNISDQTILEELPRDYHRFLTYVLARELVSVFRVSKAWTPLLENEYQTMKQNLMDNADLELGADGNRGQLNLPSRRYGMYHLGVIS